MADERINAEETINEKDFEILDATATLEDTISLHRYIYSNLIKVCTIIGILMLALAVVLRVFTDASVNVLTVCGVLMFVYLLFLIVLSKSNARKGYEKSIGASEVWHVYNDSIVYRVVRDGIERFMIRIDANRISELAVLKDVYAFKYENMAFCIAKYKVKEGSMLFNLLFPNGAVNSRNPKKTLENSYRFLSAITLIYAIICVRLVESSFAPWMFLIGAALALTCIVLWGVARGRGIKIKGSVITNIVAVLILVFFALATLASLFSDTLDNVNNSLGYTESESATLDVALDAAGLAIPQTDDKTTYKYKLFDSYSKRYVNVKNTTLFLNEEQNEGFCECVEGDGKWVTNLDDATQNFFASFIEIAPGDVFFVYNITEGTYNSIPTTNSACDYLVIVFTSRYEYIDIYEFLK